MGLFVRLLNRWSISGGGPSKTAAEVEVDNAAEPTTAVGGATTMVTTIVGAATVSEILSPLTWMDAMLNAQLRLRSNGIDESHIFSSFSRYPSKAVYPLNVKPQENQTIVDEVCQYPEIMYTHWQPGGARFFGIADHAVSASEGGRTVQGEWPDRIDTLVFLGIRKNAHTLLLNTLGDLRQRLTNSSSTLHTNYSDFEPLMQSVYQRQRQQVEQQRAGDTPKIMAPLVFAILRDPLERFLSASCQDLTQFSQLSVLRSGCEQNLNNTKLLIDCILSRLHRGMWWCHQIPQVTQITRGLMGYNISVSFALQSQALPSLLEELGGQSATKTRDRTMDKVYQKEDDLRRICQWQAADLTEYQKQAICYIYQDDVRLLRAAGFALEYCGNIGNGNATGLEMASLQATWEKPQRTAVRPIRRHPFQRGSLNVLQ